VSKVEIPFEGMAPEKATLLLAAAEELGQDQSCVEVRSGHFLAPQEVADKAFSNNRDENVEKKPVKKAAAKKSAPSETQE